MTNDINRRLSEHNDHDKSTRTTFKLSDYCLVFCQIVEGTDEARKLEKYLKSGSGREIRQEIVKYQYTQHLGS